MDDVVIRTVHIRDHHLRSFMVRAAKSPCFQGEPIFPWSFQLELFYTVIIPTRIHRVQISHFSGSFTIFSRFVYFSRHLLLIIQVKRYVHEKVFKKDPEITNCVVE